MIYFLGSRPLETRNLDETLNEMVIMLVVYHFVCLSNGGNKFLEIVLGTSCIIVVGGHMAISLAIICRHTFILLKTKCKRYLSNRKRRAYEMARKETML